MHTKRWFHRPTLPAVRISGVVLLIMVIVGAAQHSIIPAHAQDPADHGVVHGWVRDAATGRGVAGARVQLGSLVVATDATGAIPPTHLRLAGPVQGVDVEVTAPGFGRWLYVGVELAVTHPVELHVELTNQPQVRQPQANVGVAVAPFDGPPDYIKIGRTFSTSCVYPPTNVQRVDQVPFIDYVQNVLPNEWVPSWPAASLDAGAVAAAQFAWSSAFVNGKWTRQGYPFHVVDSVCDQVYKDRSPAVNYTSTDSAVGRMWGTALVRDNKLITTFFRDRDESCVRSNSNDCMGQWGSYYKAQAGLSGLQILHHYYDPVVDVRTAPAYRGLVLRQSPDLQLWPGRTQTLSVCMRNVGRATWQHDRSTLNTVDPLHPQNASYVSPFANPSWRSTQQPATLTQVSAATGQSGTWTFAVSAPPSLAPGTYRFVVEPRQADGTPIPTDSPLSWTINVLDTAPTFSQKTFLPMLSAPSAATATLKCP